MQLFRYMVVMLMALTMLSLSGAPLISLEFERFRVYSLDAKKEMTNIIESGSTLNEHDVSFTGGQVIGMIPYALAGQYVLAIDGIVIVPETKLETIDLRGVVGGNYNLVVARDAGNVIQSVVATRE